MQSMADLLTLETIGRPVNVHPGNCRLTGRPHPAHNVCHASEATTMLWNTSSAKMVYTDHTIAFRSRGKDTW